MTAITLGAWLEAGGIIHVCILADTDADLARQPLCEHCLVILAARKRVAEAKRPPRKRPHRPPANLHHDVDSVARRFGSPH